MEIKKYPLKFSLLYYIGLLLLILLLSGCTAVVPSTNESQITQVISNFFQAINEINREKALSYTVPNGPAYDMTNKFFDTKIPLAAENNTQYKYTFDIQTISILNDTTVSVELTYSFRLLGTTGLVSPTFNGNFTLKKVNEAWLLDTAPFAN
jgi:PBP1b-binding outer membrane lipoprotein LpoB